MGRLKRLSQLARESDIQEFLAEHGLPVLVPTGVLGGDLKAAAARDANATMLHGEEEEMDLVMLGLNRTHTLAPSGGTDFAQRGLRIGRTADCDVTIVDYTISKSHARLIPANWRRTARLVDLGSRNGTWINDEQLPRGVEVDLPCGALVRMGRMIFTYLSPRGLYAYLNESN